VTHFTGGRFPCIVKKFRSSTASLFLFVLFSNVRPSAQVSQQIQDLNAAASANAPITMYETAPNTAVIVVHVFADEKPVKLDRSARIDLTNVANHLGVFITAPAHEQAVFTNVVRGRYSLAVNAVGYLSAHQDISVLSPLTQEISVVLKRDPYAVTLREALGPMSDKAKKEAKKAVSLLKADRLSEARKHLENAYKLAPSNADVNFLLGYMYFAEKDYGTAGTYLGAAARISPNSSPTLSLLGRTQFLSKNYPAARSALEQAILADDEDWLPHNLLAIMYLDEKEFRKARDEAQIAVAKATKYGKRASGLAALTLGQAQIGLGKKDEAIQALETVLKNSPENPMLSEIRTMISNLQKGDSTTAANEGSTNSRIRNLDPDLLAALPKPPLSMQTWRPPDIDDVKPTLAPGVACPINLVLAGAGQRAEELVQNVTRLSADEFLFHKSLDGAGLSTSTETRKYEYVAAIFPEAGRVRIDEYRADPAPQGGYPDGIASAGFIMLALVFHPQMQGDFDYDCEGQGKWRGQPSWLVHFRQRHGLPSRMQSYFVDGKTYLVDLKGRAWISADSFQIEHIEADIASPIHEIQLLSEHQIVEYGPIPFAKKNMMLWLPTSAEIYLDFRKHHYYRRHSFEHFMVFDVGTSQEDNRQPDTSKFAPTSTKEKGLPN